VASGTGTRMDAYFAVNGLSPATAYWYRFDGAVVAGPVYTSSSSASVSPSNPAPSDPVPSDPAPSDPAPPVCTAAYRVLSQWPGGFYAEVAVTVADAALSGWSLSWTLAPGQRIQHAWGAVTTVAGDGTVVARNTAWNGTLAAHAGTTMGFVGSWQGSNPVPVVTCR
jgi:mannan endo-1,4-beta-mannosidase